MLGHLVVKRPSCSTDPPCRCSPCRSAITPSARCAQPKPHPGTRAQQNQAVGLDDRCAGGGNVAAHALAGEEQLFAVHIGLLSGPCKDILCIGVQAVKSSYPRTRRRPAVAVEIEPGAADALRCQSAGQVGVHGLVAAAAAGKAVQMHHKGYLAPRCRAGSRCRAGCGHCGFKLNL